MISLPSHVTAGLSDDGVSNLGMIASRVQQLQKQGMPQNQIAAAIQQELTTVPNMIPLSNAYALYNYLKAHPANVQPPSQDSVAVSMAKQITQQDEQAKMAQMARAQAQMQQQMPPQGGMPQGAAPQQPQMPMREGGIASLPVRNIGDEKNYARGGIVAFDEGGNIQAQYLTEQQQRMLANAANQQMMAQQQQEQQSFNKLVDPTQGVYAAAHGGAIHHYAVGGSADDEDEDDDDTDDGYDPNAVAGHIQGIRGRLNISNSTGLPPVGPRYTQQVMDYMKANPRMNSHQAMLALEKQEGIGDAYNEAKNYIAQSEDQINQMNDYMAGDYANKMGAAAGLAQASKTGRDPGYAGTGLSGILASLGANMQASAQAKALAMRDKMSSLSSLAKLRVDSAMNDEARKSQNLRTDVNYDRAIMTENQRLLANAMNADSRVDAADRAYDGHRLIADATIKRANIMAGARSTPGVITPKVIADQTARLNLQFNSLANNPASTIAANLVNKSEQEQALYKQNWINSQLSIIYGNQIGVQIPGVTAPATGQPTLQFDANGNPK